MIDTNTEKFLKNYRRLKLPCACFRQHLQFLPFRNATHTHQWGTARSLLHCAGSWWLCEVWYDDKSSDNQGFQLGDNTLWHNWCSILKYSFLKKKTTQTTTFFYQPWRCVCLHDKMRARRHLSSSAKWFWGLFELITSIVSQLWKRAVRQTPQVCSRDWNEGRVGR